MAVDFFQQLKHARKGMTVIWKGREFDFDSIASSDEVYITGDGERYRVKARELKPGMGFQNSSFQNGRQRAMDEIAGKTNTTFLNNWERYTKIDAWKTACQKEFNKRGLEGAIRWSSPNSAGDIFAYINATFEYVGKWYSSNSYGEVKVK